MRHKGLIFGVSLGLAGLVYFLVWLVQAWVGGSPALPFAFAMVVFTVSLVLTGQAYWRSTRILREILSRYDPEQVLYHDVAGYMEDGHERVGGLVVTTRRVVFETPENLKGKKWEMAFTFSEIALVKNYKGYFQMAAGGRDNRFKVFRCDELVECIQKGAAEATQQKMAALKAQRGQPGAPAAPPPQPTAPPPQPAPVQMATPSPQAPPPVQTLPTVQAPQAAPAHGVASARPRMRRPAPPTPPAQPPPAAAAPPPATQGMQNEKKDA